jgi:hypothetical protein
MNMHGDEERPSGVMRRLRSLWTGINRVFLQYDCGPQGYVGGRVALLESRIERLEARLGRDAGNPVPPRVANLIGS